ncbi:MAG: hypothetical protein CML12_00140 [Puniceicoccaceae bacterium]|nr:hypothetical protein [Puniceicoccaceae bacterium]|tara:strand:- start:131 stop:667 length:537 start_codon:yes stop_codon:yes gene_type:complete
MSLFYATFITGLCLIFSGATLIFSQTRAKEFLTAFPRSKAATYYTMAIAMAWFSFRIYNLDTSDFGDYKQILLVLFLAITVSSFYFVPDFLSVRALAGIILLISDVLLDAAFMREPSQRLFLVSFVYVMILLSFIIGASPYLMRDALKWLYKETLRIKILAYTLIAYGSLLTWAALSY